MIPSNELRDKVFDIAQRKGWNKGSYKHYICLVVSELMEAVEAYRKNQHSNKDLFLKNIDRSKYTESLQRWGEKFYSGILTGAFQSFIKGTVEEELADTFIRLLHLAGLNNINLEELELKPSYHPESYDTFTEWVFTVCKEIFDNDNYGQKVLYIIIDTMEYVMGYCAYHKIDLEFYVREKLRYIELLQVVKKNEQCNLNHA